MVDSVTVGGERRRRSRDGWVDVQEARLGSGSIGDQEAVEQRRPVWERVVQRVCAYRLWFGGEGWILVSKGVMCDCRSYSSVGRAQC
jgi:hypothetical protein